MLCYCKHRHKNVLRGRCSEGVIENQSTSQILVADATKIAARVIHQRQNNCEVDNKLFRTGVVDLCLFPRTITCILRVLIDLISIHTNCFFTDVFAQQIPATDNFFCHLFDIHFGDGFIGHSCHKLFCTFINLIHNSSRCNDRINLRRDVKADHLLLVFTVIYVYTRA